MMVLLQFIITGGTCMPDISANTTSDDISNGDRVSCIRAICMSNEQTWFIVGQWTAEYGRRFDHFHILSTLYSFTIHVSSWAMLYSRRCCVTRRMRAHSRRIFYGRLKTACEWYQHCRCRRHRHHTHTHTQTMCVESQSISDWVYESVRTQSTK